jgi:beta-glucosidase
MNSMASNLLRAEDGQAFRDLNKNGVLDPYEDPRRPIEERIEDLLSQMTLEEKAGLMFHMIAGVNPDGTLAAPAQGFFRASVAEFVEKLQLTHFNVHALPEPRLAAAWYNRLRSSQRARAWASPSRSPPTHATRSQTIRSPASTPEASRSGPNRSA